MSQEDCAQLIREGLKDFEQEIFLLHAGIDRESACAIELGPDIGVSAYHCAVWSGVCPDRSAGKHGRSRKGNPMLRKVLVRTVPREPTTVSFEAGTSGSLRNAPPPLTNCFVCSVLRDRKPYRDPETDYEAV